MFVIEDFELPCPRCMGRGKIDVDITKDGGFGTVLKMIREIEVNRDVFRLIFYERYSSQSYSYGVA